MIDLNSFLHNTLIYKMVYKVIDRDISNLVFTKLSKQILTKIHLPVGFFIDIEVDSVIKDSIFDKYYDK